MSRAAARDEGRVAALGELQALLGDRLTTAAAMREAHGRDESWHAVAMPDAVAFARTTEEVAAIIRICSAYDMPVIPFGAGTSLEGHVSAVHGGLSLDLSQMNAILEVNAADLDVRVEAGVTRKQLNDYLRDTGLFFPIDPGANATIGGMVATRASGTNAVRYGTMRENVLNLTAVMADGSVVRTARRARKSSAGYDLTRLLIGSEGTLGIVTEVTLRLYGIPEAIRSGVVPFASIEGAVDAVIETIQSGLPVARIEILDPLSIRACNAYSKLTLAEVPTLFVEFHGTDASVAEQAERFGAIASEHGGGASEWATKAEDRTKLWEARHNAYYAALAYAPGKKGMVTDVCVPISRLAEAIRGTLADLETSFLKAPIVGHVGDGNFHMLLLMDPANPQDLAEATRLHDRMVARALSLDGTCTGEHGIGEGKIKFLEAEHGTGVAVMRAIKQALDPKGILNPGKIFSA
ncbi:D-lactate dehydrogenase (cytochrome) [Parvibaculum lavamentivorans DS-1]|uniref:D-lactate dehydrogenase (cytochrome) n=1 Tax=Parvibaculum lavamentivorans (strain DS-1 / DSM 13023 / NCIMB 13966) TaxID=402881 RepID=A7HVW5_PARL1|nr:FAD-linked oxidase C-terminal domain-containing protein [Parvibaculum lavamentivorans]ABS64048.1 D-lactate dehydrogenase (cytochrome) [Parvibaculum lavamentivorans DS-1]